MDQMGAMMGGMGLIGILTILVLILAAAALLKHRCRARRSRLAAVVPDWADRCVPLSQLSVHRGARTSGCHIKARIIKTVPIVSGSNQYVTEGSSFHTGKLFPLST